MSLTYKATLDSTQAERSLTNLSNSVNLLNNNFIKLRDRIATISLTAIITQAITFADTLKDLSDATEISTDNILGFSNAVAANGGTMDGAQKGIARLVASIDDAANSAGAGREAFKDVGVSLTDLRTKSSQQIFDQVVKGLAGIGDVATRARLATELLGKEARNINFKSVADDYSAATAAAQRYSGAIASSAQANDNIAKAIKTFQLEVIKLIQPITDFINNIKVSTDAVSNFFDILGTAVKYAAYAVGFTLLGRAIWVIGSAAVAAYGAITEITGGIIGLVRALASSGTRSALLENLALLGGGIGQKVVVVLEAMGISTAFVAKHWVALTAGISGAIGALTAYLGLSKDPNSGENQNEIQRLKARADAAAKQREEIIRGQEALEKMRQTQAKYNLESKQQLEILGESLSNLSMKYFTERQLFNLSEDQREVQKALLDLDDQRVAKVKDLNREIAKLTLEQQGTKDEDQNKILGARIGILKAQKTEVDALYGRHATGLKDQITALQEIRNQEKSRLSTLDATVSSIDRMVAAEEKYRSTMQDIQQTMSDVQFGQTQRGKSPLEQQIAEIRRSSEKAAKAAGEALMQGIDASTTSPADLLRLQQAIDDITESYNKLAEAQINALGGGLSYAWDEYKSKALDTIGQIKSGFETFTSGLEDAFVRFVQGGKLSFKDLANSILADLARIAFKKAVLGIGTLFGLPGRASGGPVDANRPYVVGEKGPELFMPKSAGTIIPNNALSASQGGSMGGSTTVNYNIQAVDAASFRSLVARDPSFIYAVTEQGRRSQPSRSR